MRKTAILSLALLPALALGQAVSPTSSQTNIVGGTFNVPGSVTVSALPATAATSTAQTDGSQKTQIVDGADVTLGVSAHPVRVDPTGTTSQPVTFSAPQHVIVDSGSMTGGLTNTELRAAAVPVSGPVTDAQLRAAPIQTQVYMGAQAVDATHPLPVDVGANLSVNINTTGLAQGSAQTDGSQKAQIVNASGATIGVAGVPLRVDPTGTTAQPVTGPLTDTQLRASPVPVSGPLTNTELRATAVPVSGTVTATGPLTDTQLRASAVPVTDSRTPAGLSAPTSAPAGTEAGLIVRPIPSGTQTIQGAGTAGTADTHVVTIQGIASGVAVPISGSITASNASVGTPGGAAPSGATYVMGLNGTTTQVFAADSHGSLKVLQVDSSGNALTAQANGQATMANSIPVAIASDQSAIAVTGALTDSQLRATAVPVSLASVPSHAVTGPLTDTQLRATAVPVSLASAPTTPVTNAGLPAGLGQTTMAASMPVTLASNQSAIVTTPIPSGATKFQCSIAQGTTTTTQCYPAPGSGLNFYLTQVTLSNGSTPQTLQLVQGTGTTCTTPTAIGTAKAFNGNAGAPLYYGAENPMKGSLVNAALCVTPGSSGAFGADIVGYIAP